jgi:hypothetical protein
MLVRLIADALIASQRPVTHNNTVVLAEPVGMDQKNHDPSDGA